MADWEKCSKLGCIVADCVGTFDIRASLSDDAGRFVFGCVACPPPLLPSHLRSTAIHLRHSPATTIAIVLLRRKTFLQLTVLRRCMQRIATKKPFANRLYLSIQSASAKLPCRGRIGFMSLSTRCSTQWCRPVAHIAQRPLQTLVDAPHCSVVHA